MNKKIIIGIFLVLLVVGCLEAPDKEETTPTTIPTIDSESTLAQDPLTKPTFSPPPTSVPPRGSRQYVSIPEIEPNMATYIEFLEVDQTNKNDFIWDEYMCGNFSVDLQQNCTKANIPMNIWWQMNESGNRHFMNAFSYNDSWYIVNPQTDEMWNIEDYLEEKDITMWVIFERGTYNLTTNRMGDRGEFLGYYGIEDHL